MPPTNVEEIQLELPGGTLAAKQWGPDDGRKVLALHGWLDNAGSFDALAPELHGARLVAIDLPGHGRSAHHPPGHPYAFIDYVAVVSALLAELQWSSCVLMGHSLGAGIAAVFAGASPECIEHLVLIEGLGPLTETADAAPERLARALREERDKRGKQAPVYPTREDVLARLQRANSLPREAAEILLERSIIEVEGGVTWRSDPRLRWASRARFSEEQVLAFLRRITAPTLVVRASEGFAIPEEIASRRLEAIHRASVIELPGRHHVHLEQPRALAEAVMQFWNAFPSPLRSA